MRIFFLINIMVALYTNSVAAQMVGHPTLQTFYYFSGKGYTEKGIDSIMFIVDGSVFHYDEEQKEDLDTLLSKLDKVKRNGFFHAKKEPEIKLYLAGGEDMIKTFYVSLDKDIVEIYTKDWSRTDIEAYEKKRPFMFIK